jgi:hypothetical protein
MKQVNDGRNQAKIYSQTCRNYAMCILDPCMSIGSSPRYDIKKKPQIDKIRVTTCERQITNEPWAGTTNQRNWTLVAGFFYFASKAGQGPSLPLLHYRLMTFKYLSTVKEDGRKRKVSILQRTMRQAGL